MEGMGWKGAYRAALFYGRFAGGDSLVVLALFELRGCEKIRFNIAVIEVGIARTHQRD